MRTVATKSATMALIFGHIAGMIDLAALPVWIGTLVGGFGFTNTEAGGLVTGFLAGVVIASVLISPVIHRMPGHVIASGGYLVSGIAFFWLSVATPSPSGFLILHLVAGLATGAAISTTHGAMGRAENPHRIFALGSAGFGLFAVLFLGAAPRIVAAFGPSSFFAILALVMAIAGCLTMMLFPRMPGPRADAAQSPIIRFPRAVWLVIFAVLLMNLAQAITFSFVERIGVDSGYSAGQIQGVLLGLGVVNLFPALAALMLQQRLRAIAVGIGGAILQAALSLAIAWSFDFVIFAVPTLFFSAVMIFTHTFLFGHLAALDPSGRATAATPAMTMSGSAIAPLLGGVLADSLGYHAIGVFVAMLACVTVTLLACAGRQSPTIGPQTAIIPATD